MARKRMIDSNIWKSQDVSKLSHFSRLLFIGMFSNADDYGKGIASVEYLRSSVFPYDNIKIPNMNKALSEIKQYIAINFYEVDGNQYYKFINWKKWQSVGHPTDSIIPEPLMNESGEIIEPLLPSIDKDSIDEVSVDEDKKKYADFVTLTEKEYEKLKTEFNEEGAKERITALNLYKGSKGKKYDSDYLTILNWDRKEKKERAAQTSPQKEAPPQYKFKKE